VNNKLRICVITGTRAEYGLLYWILKEIQVSSDLELKIIATGMHLSPEFGLTYKQIEADGFLIDRKVEILLSSDTPTAISKSMGLGMIGFADAYQEIEPDLILVLGDRFEIFSAVSSAMIAKIPVAHLHGGEATEGLIDEAIRHSITKMSHLHFTATEEYRNRVIQLGEQPERVFNVGAVGIDNINRLTLMPFDEFERSINFKLGKKNLLVTFHPVTLENSTSKEQFANLLEVLVSLDETHIIFTKPNADTDGRIISQMIDSYVADNSETSVSFNSMGQLRYLSALTYVDAVVGNSSSGLIEAPSFHIGTVNIGDRQRGRISADSVINCDSSENGIKEAIVKIYSSSFQNILSTVENPYGKGGASDKIVDYLKDFSLTDLIKKKFYDLKVKS
jgi:GDP/UDP-N,N'-diacetylbacillosamine 2-epimerase (hydrolysing)